MLRATFMLLAVAAVVVVLLGGAGLYVVLNLQDFREDIAQAMTDLLDRPTAIDAVSVSWDGAVPLVAVSNLTILDQDGNTLAGFEMAQLRLDVWASLRDAALRVSQMRITGAALGVERDAAGGVRIVGLGNAPAGNDAPLSTRRLLLGPGNVEFSDARLVIRDVRFGDQALTLGLRMQITHDGTSQRIHGEIQLPDSRQSIAVSGQLGIDETGTNWLANLNVGGRDIRLSPLARLMPGATLPGADASADLGIKLRFTNGELTRASGRIALKSLRVLEDGPLPGPSELGGAFQYSPIEAGWLLKVTDLEVSGAMQAWTAKDARLRYRLGSDGGPGRYTAKVSSARLEDVLAIIAYLEPGTEDVDNIREYAAFGSAQELSAAWLDVSERQAPFAAAFTFEGLGWPERKAENWGIKGLSGFASITPEGGVINLASRDPVTIEASEVFPRILKFDAVSGTVALKRDGSTIAMRSAGIRMRGRQLNAVVSGDVVSDDDPSLLMGLEIRVAEMNTSQLRGLLPSPVFPAQFNRWLGGAFKSGSIEKIKIALNGRVRDLTVAPDDDSVRVSGQMRNIKLAYAKGWPDFEQLEGEFDLAKGRLQIAPAQARMYKTKVEVSATADELATAQPALKLNLKSKGTANDLLRLLRNSPIASQLPPAVRKLKATGNALVNSNIVLTGDASAVRARSVIRLDGANLQLDDTLPTVRALKGELVLDTGKLSARKLSGTWLGQAVRLDLNASAAGSGKLRITTRVTPTTLTRLATLAGIEAPDWIGLIHGASPWTVELQGAASGRVRFAADTKLSGTRIDLPAPLGKSSKSARVLALSGEIKDEQARVNAQYGPIRLSSIVHLNRAGAVGYKVGFNQQVQPARLGERSIVGTLSLLDLDAWSAFLDPDSDTARLSMPRVDVTLNSLRFAGVSFPRTRVKVEKPDAARAVTVLLDGPNLAGRVKPPRAQAPLRIDLDRLIVPEFKSVDAAPTDPSRVPAFTFSAKHLVYGGVDLGTLKISASSAEAGLNFDTLYLISPLFDLEGKGYWHRNGAGQQSNFSVKIFANELTQLLVAAGIDSRVSDGGPTQINARVGWAGTPGDFSLGTVSGEMAFRVGRGHLLDVDAGAGARLFSLLSLRSLPQILSLDMGSVFEEGMEFSGIRGDFTLDGGNAYTNNLTMDSKPASIAVSGRTGLIDEDYDQTVTVQPNLSDSLPVAGAAFGGVGAGVGAALWLAEKLLDTKLVDQAASFRYTVTGAWDRPSVVRVREAEGEDVDR